MPDNRILIVANELQKHLHDTDWAIVDCRSDLADPEAGRRSYEQRHIPGAVFLDLDTDLAGPIGADTGRHPLPEIASVASTLQARGIGSGNTIAVYDGGNGSIAARAWWILRWLGHERVFVLDGGFAHWTRLGLPTESGTVHRAPAGFDVSVHTDWELTTRELAGDPGGIRARNLLDARDRIRFLGEAEPIDPVAGHIPGAISLPFAEFVRADGTWRPLAERARLLEGAIGSDREVSWSVMCGSGVTACHLAISGLEAGYREPRVYVGSWSEWIRDDRRPIGLGLD